MTSTLLAASPETRIVAPGATRSAVGATSARSRLTTAFWASSSPSGIGTLTSAVRPFSATRKEMSPRPSVTARARSPSASRRVFAAGERRSSALTTSSALSGAPGNAASIACCACTTGSWSGRLLTFSDCCMSIAGTAMAPRMQTVTTSAATGRPVTAWAMRPHTPTRGGRAARRRARRRAPGRRPRSMPSPSFARTAGRTVTEPTTAIATTSIVASAIEANTARPVTSMPARATMTVRPETTTARPTVADVARSAASASRPLRRSSRSRRT